MPCGRSCSHKLLRPWTQAGSFEILPNPESSCRPRPFQAVRLVAAVVAVAHAYGAGCVWHRSHEQARTLTAVVEQCGRPHRSRSRRGQWKQERPLGISPAQSAGVSGGLRNGIPGGQLTRTIEYAREFDPRPTAPVGVQRTGWTTVRIERFDAKPPGQPSGELASWAKGLTQNENSRRRAAFRNRNGLPAAYLRGR
jgi:hypothetical protein